MSIQDNMDSKRTYDCEVLQELPQPESMRHLFYPGATRSGGRDGLMIAVRVVGADPWLGTFAFGTLTPQSVSGIFAMPNPDRLCVVSRGRGFVVSASEPADYEEIDCQPILDVRPVPSRALVVFSNFTELLAYGETGIQWRTARLSWDGMKIVQVTDDTIRGECWDFCTEKVVTFTVDLATGKHEGGVQFPS